MRNIYFFHLLVSLIAILLSLFFIQGCKEDNRKTNHSSANDSAHSGDGDNGLARADFTPITITRDSKDLLFTFLDQSGSFKTVDSIDKIPAKSRHNVSITDLKLSPKERQAGKILYIADLTSPDPQGKYPYSIIGRYSFEKKILKNFIEKFGSHTGDLIKSDKIVHFYETAWCSVCKKAKNWLRSRNIPFLAKDIEKKATFQREMLLLAQKAGLSLGGVPVIVYKDVIIQGYDQEKLEQLVADFRDNQTQPSSQP